MGFNLEALIPLIIALLIFVFGGSRRKKAAQRSAERNTEVDAPPHDSEEVVFPPFMENFEELPPEETELVQETVENTEAAMPMVVQQSTPETVQEPTPEKEVIESPPVPVDSPVPLPTKPVPITSLIDPSPETFRQGIILAEILGKPKGLRRR